MAVCVLLTHFPATLRALATELGAQRWLSNEEWAMELGVELVLLANLVCSRLNLKQTPLAVTSLEVHSAALASEAQPSQAVVANEFAKTPVELPLDAYRCLVHARPARVRARRVLRVRLLRGLLRESSLQPSLAAQHGTADATAKGFKSQRHLPVASSGSRLSCSEAGLLGPGLARHGVTWRVICKKSCLQLVSSSAPWGQWVPVFGLLLPSSWSLSLSEGLFLRRSALACRSRVLPQRGLLVPHHPTPLWQEFAALVSRSAFDSQLSKPSPAASCCEAAMRRFNCTRQLPWQLTAAAFAQTLLTFEPLKSYSLQRYSAFRRWNMICKHSCVQLVSLRVVYPKQRKVYAAVMVLTACGTHRAGPLPFLLCRPYTDLSMTKSQPSAAFDIASHESVKDVALCGSRCVGAEKHLPACLSKPLGIRQGLTPQQRTVRLRRWGHPSYLDMPASCAERAEPIVSWPVMSSGCCAWSPTLLEPLTHGQRHPVPLWKMICKHSSVLLVSFRAVHPILRKLPCASCFVLTASCAHRAEPLPFPPGKPYTALSIAKLLPSAAAAAFTIACDTSVKDVALCSSRCVGAEQHLPVCPRKGPVIAKSFTLQPHSWRTVLSRRCGHPCCLALPAACAGRAEQIVFSFSSLAMSPNRWPISQPFGSLGLDRSGSKHPALSKIVFRKLLRRRVKLLRQSAGSWVPRACPAWNCGMPRRWSCDRGWPEHDYRVPWRCFGAQLSASSVSRMTPAALLCSLLTTFQMLLVQCRVFGRRLEDPGLASHLHATASRREQRLESFPLRLCRVELKAAPRCDYPSSLQPVGKSDVAHAPTGVTLFKTLGAIRHPSQMLRMRALPPSLNHSLGRSVLTSLRVKDFCSLGCLAEEHGQREYPVLLGRGSSSKRLESEQGPPSAQGLSPKSFGEHAMPANRVICLNVQMSLRGTRLRKLPR